MQVPRRSPQHGHRVESSKKTIHAMKQRVVVNAYIVGHDGKEGLQDPCALFQGVVLAAQCRKTVQDTRASSKEGTALGTTPGQAALAKVIRHTLQLVAYCLKEGMMLTTKGRGSFADGCRRCLIRCQLDKFIILDQLPELVQILFGQNFVILIIQRRQRHKAGIR